MKLYWKEKFDRKGNWSHLEFEVSNSPKPSSKIVADNNYIFKIQIADKILAWGKIESDYYGCWFLPNRVENETSQNFIKPITAQDIEKSTLSVNDKNKFWATYFLDKLKQSKFSMLHDGTWEIGIARNNAVYPIQNWKRFDIKEIGNNKIPTYIAWDFNEKLKLLPLKKIDKNETGRVKWWRKKIREGNCPPILGWFVSALDSFILIDGHSRLQAFLLEQKMPSLLVVNLIQKIDVDSDFNKRESIVRAIENREKHPFKSKLSVEQSNNLLLNAFDDSPYNKPITKSVAKKISYETWQAEISQFKNHPDIDLEELDCMMLDS